MRLEIAAPGCRSLSAGWAELGLPRYAFVRFTGMFDVIFKFIIPLWQSRSHHVNPRRRVAAMWTEFDCLAENELMGQLTSSRYRRRDARG